MRSFTVTAIPRAESFARISGSTRPHVPPGRPPGDTTFTCHACEEFEQTHGCVFAAVVVAVGVFRKGFR